MSEQTKEPEELKEPEMKEPEAKEPEKEPETKEPEAEQQEPKETPPPSKETHSSSESGKSEHLAELVNLVKIHGEKIKATHDLMESYRTEQTETVAELRETIDLLQQVIAEKDSQLQKLIKSVHALTIVHEEQVAMMKAGK